MKSPSRLRTPPLEAFPAPELDVSQLSRELFASCGEGIVAYDRELRHVAWNPFMEELTGRPATDVLGRTAAEVFPHLGDQGVVPLLERALSGETVTSHDISWPAPP